jgi:uncharacterized membrane protein YheB (UPF0754 family)
MSKETFAMLSLITIPLISGLIGWFTNWLAIRMTFYPIEYVGVRPFGWQGIIPSKARRMASKSVDLITSKLLKIDERVAQINPTHIAEEMQPGLEELSHRLVHEVMEAQSPQVWKNTPDFVKKRIYESISKDLPEVVVQMIEDIKANINDLLDIKAIAVRTLTRDRALLNKVFQECGKEEFKFLIISGLYFGFVFGLPQMVVSYFYNPWWFLPLFGMIVGYATNAVALKLIFRPLYPKRILGLFAFQGLFLKRQKEVAEAYAKIVDQEIVTTESMFEYVMRGPGAQKLAEIIQEHVGKVVDDTIGNTKGLVELVVGKKMEAVKNIAVYRLVQELPISVRSIFHYTHEALDIENQLNDKMQSLAPQEFEGFLRPVFQEDETTLILVGAFLGLVAGMLQWYFLFY